MSFRSIPLVVFERSLHTHTHILGRNGWDIAALEQQEHFGLAEEEDARHFLCLANYVKDIRVVALKGAMK